MASIRKPPYVPPTSSDAIDGIQKAAKTLLKWSKSKAHCSSSSDTSGDNFIKLVVTLKESCHEIQMLQVRLDHAVVPLNSNISLIIGDQRSQNSIEVVNFKQLVLSNYQSDNYQLEVTQFSKLRDMHHKYPKYEENFCNSYNFFWVDKSILDEVPYVFGEYFCKKRKIPIPVNLDSSDLELEIKNAVKTSVLYRRNDTICVIRVGHENLSASSIAENTIAALGGIVGILPRGMEMVLRLEMKFAESISLPVFSSED